MVGRNVAGVRSAIRHGVVVAAVFCATVACGPAPSLDGASGASTNVDANVDGNVDGNAAGHVHGSPPPPPAPLRNGERFLQVGLQRPYRPTPPQGGTDEY